MRIRTIALLLAALCMAAVLAGCGGGAGQDTGKNADKYGAAVSFEGEAHDARVMFVNVGKADCAVVDIDGSVWLVDTGTEESFVRTYSALEALGVNALAGIVLTHEHDDHVGGLENMVTKFPVKTVYSPEYLMSRIEIDSKLTDLEIKGVTVKAGDTIPVAGGVAFEVLAPQSLITASGDDNDNSMILRLTVNGRTFLFTGDMQNAEETALMESGAQLAADVLKVGNHGNKDATSDAFAKAVSPLIAVISTDTNVDANSASGVVRQRLGMADVILTQNSELGVLLTVSKKGEISVSYPERHKAEYTQLAVTEASKADQTFTVTNSGSEDIDISGWFVWSTKGCEVFIYPEGTVVPAGGSVMVACRKSALADSADIVWQKKKVWADSKQDYAVLCDAYGNELGRCLSK